MDQSNTAVSCTPASPRAVAILDIAWITNAMCSSRSTPSSAAPLTRSSRLTPAAKPFVFIFLRTEETSRPVMLLLGRTRAVASITKCHSRRLATVLPELRALFGGTSYMASVSDTDGSPGQSKRIRDTAHRLNDESDMLIQINA